MRDPFFAAPTPLVRLTQPFASNIGLSSLPAHLHEVGVAFLWYQFLFKVASPVLSRKLLPNSYGHLPKRSQINWDVHFTSFVQSTMICACAIYVATTDRERAEMDWQGRLWGYTGAGGMVQAFAAGYFLWDLVASVVHLDILGMSSLLHAIGALLVTSLGFRPFANYYGLNFILYELSTPFLNIHWFLDKLQMTGSQAQLVNGVILMLSFAGCRLGWGTYQSILIYRDIWTAWKSPLSSESEGNSTLLTGLGSIGLDPKGAASHRLPFPTWLVVAYLGANTMLTLLNFYWFRKMVSAMLKRFQPSESTEDSKKKKS